MNTSITRNKYMKTQTDVYNMIKNHGKIIKPEGSILEHTFFQNSGEVSDINIDMMGQINSVYIERVNKPFNNADLGLKMFYYLLGDENLQVSFNDFTFLNLKDIENRSDEYDHMLDIAVKYVGMGHVVMLTLDKNTGLFFFRRDGGSNGYDREAYYQKYKTLDPSKYTDKMYSVNAMFSMMSEDELIMKDFESISKFVI